MASKNAVELIGNLGRDPEVRNLPSGDLVANFSLATTDTWRDKEGSKKEDTQWHQVEVFGKAAEVVRDHCKKGQQILVEGSIRYDEWTDKDGVKKTKAKIKVSGPNSRVLLLGSRSNSERRDVDQAAGAEEQDVA
jgi:single-strand DNA-binding protein